MNFRCLALCAVASLVGAVAHANTYPLFLQEEQVPQILNYSSSSNLYSIAVDRPVLCANTGSAANGGATGGKFNPVYNNFVFGPYTYSPTSGLTTQTPTAGLTYVQYKTSISPASYVIQADSTLGTPPLVCYVTDTSGIRLPTRDFFEDSFDHDYTPGAPVDVYDSSVTVTVEPTPPNGYYQVYFDINIPTPAKSATFVLRSGFNTRVFSPSGSIWCQAAATTDTLCPSGGSVSGNVDFTRTLSPIDAPTQLRFIVAVPYNSGITPNSGELLALAALFSPDNIEEVPLGNNVAAASVPVQVTR